jgi:hypothetical protein
MELPYFVPPMYSNKPIKFIQSGEWDKEPNVYAWREYPGVTTLLWYPQAFPTMDCAVIRNPQLGHLCGYVKMPKGYELSEDALDSLEVHGGVTYDKNNWIGFDCAHSGDLAPACKGFSGVYRNFAYVKAETQRLAEQVASRYATDVELDTL